MSSLEQGVTFSFKNLVIAFSVGVNLDFIREFQGAVPRVITSCLPAAIKSIASVEQKFATRSDFIPKAKESISESGGIIFTFFK